MPHHHEWTDEEDAITDASQEGTQPESQQESSQESEAEVLQEAPAVDRLERAGKIVSFLEKIGAPEAFSSEASRAKFAKELSVDDAKNLLVHLNGIILDTPVEERKLVSDHFVQIRNPAGKIDYVPPYSGHKEELLERIVESSKHLEDPKEVGLLYAAELQALHLFDDGNGRLARLIYLLFSKDHSFDDADKEEIVNSLLSRQESRVKPYVAFLGPHTARIMAEKYAGVDFNDPDAPLALFRPDDQQQLIEQVNRNEHLSQNEKNIIADIFEDSAYAILACINFSKRGIKDFGQFISNDPSNSDYEGKGFVVFKLVASLTSEEAQGLMLEYQTLKFLYVKLLSDIIIHPDQYPADFKGAKNLKELYMICADKYGVVEGQELDPENE